MCNSTRHVHEHVHPHSHPSLTDIATQPSGPRFARRSLLQLSALGIAHWLLAACRSKPPARPSTQPLSLPVVAVPGFSAFASQIKVMSDGQYWRIESNGLPTHNMMVGIRSWQQQVPLPQPYTGENGWRIPIHPQLSDKPISARNNLFRGAIALAVNGVPIFNALNNRSDDAFLARELDDWGGHGGRADDYHYHTAPLHLQRIVGKDQPIAYALDGFPLYGLQEPDGSAVVGLDEYNGHSDTAGHYHYHASLAYPYLNGGLRGVVAVRDGQIDPQPVTTPIRPSLEPLRGAVITDFKSTGTKSYSLEYTVDGAKQYVNYQFGSGDYAFEFVDAQGNHRSETYKAA